jgi:hypothetical protein
VTPDIPGQEDSEKSFIPDAAAQAEMIKLARDGAPPRTESDARARNALEARLALAEYKPFWRIPAIPDSNALMFIVAGKDTEVDNRANALAAGLAHKANSGVRTLFDAGHALTPAEQAEAARHAAEWFKEKL